MDVVALETRFVTGRSPANGGGGDPNHRLRGAEGHAGGGRGAVERARPGRPARVVQGVGKVGTHLCSLLHEAGARLTIADVDVDNVGQAVKLFGAETVEPGKAHAVECDIFAPAPWGRWSTTTPCPS